MSETITSGELAHMAREAVENPRVEVPMILQRGVGNRIFREMYSLRPDYRFDPYKFEREEVERKWAQANWVCCTRCGRRLTDPQSVKRHMGNYCLKVAREKAKALELEAAR